jgi:hypothetical protein
MNYPGSFERLHVDFGVFADATTSAYIVIRRFDMNSAGDSVSVDAFVVDLPFQQTSNLCCMSMIDFESPSGPQRGGSCEIRRSSGTFDDPWTGSFLICLDCLESVFSSSIAARKLTNRSHCRTSVTCPHCIAIVKTFSVRKTALTSQHSRQIQVDLSEAGSSGE